MLFPSKGCNFWPGNCVTCANRIISVYIVEWVCLKLHSGWSKFSTLGSMLWNQRYNTLIPVLNDIAQAQIATISFVCIHINICQQVVHMIFEMWKCNKTWSILLDFPSMLRISCCFRWSSRMLFFIFPSK